MTSKKTIKGPKGDELKVTVRKKPLEELDPEDYKASPIDLLDEGPEVSKPLARAYLDKKPTKKDPLRYKLSTQQYKARSEVHQIALALHREHPDWSAREIADDESIRILMEKRGLKPDAVPDTAYRWVRQIIKKKRG